MSLGLTIAWPHFIESMEMLMTLNSPIIKHKVTNHQGQCQSQQTGRGTFGRPYPLKDHAHFGYKVVQGSIDKKATVLIWNGRIKFC